MLHKLTILCYLYFYNSYLNYILIFILLLYIPKQLPFSDLRDAQLDMYAEIYSGIANTSVNTKFA